jgi:hypothetical protein
MDTKFYVYALLDPRKPGPFYYGNWKFDFEPFYIGKGQGKRAYHHDRYPQQSNGSYKDNKIRKIYLETGALHIVEFKRTNLTEHQALEVEVRLIAAIGRGRVGPLTNKTSGGEGVVGLVHSKATRKRMSQSRLNRDPVVIERVQEAQRNTIKAMTDEERKSSYSRTLSIRSRNRQRAKVSQHWAALSEEQLRVIRERKQKTHAQKTLEELEASSIRRSRARGCLPINVYKGKTLIGQFPTHKSVVRSLGVPRNSVAAVLKGVREQCQGYTFEYDKG